jgi:hypothetical protein
VRAAHERSLSELGDHIEAMTEALQNCAHIADRQPDA